MKRKKVAWCKIDARKVPFVVVEGGVAAPQAPGAPGLHPPASSRRGAAGGGGGEGATSRVAVATASAA